MPAAIALSSRIRPLRIRPLFAALCVGPYLGWKRAELWPALRQLLADCKALENAEHEHGERPLAHQAQGVEAEHVAHGHPIPRIRRRVRQGETEDAEHCRRGRGLWHDRRQRHPFAHPAGPAQRSGPGLAQSPSQLDRGDWWQTSR